MIHFSPRGEFQCLRLNRKTFSSLPRERCRLPEKSSTALLSAWHLSSAENTQWRYKHTNAHDAICINNSCLSGIQTSVTMSPGRKKSFILVYLHLGFTSLHFHYEIIHSVRSCEIRISKLKQGNRFLWHPVLWGSIFVCVFVTLSIPHISRVPLWHAEWR